MKPTISIDKCVMLNTNSDVYFYQYWKKGHNSRQLIWNICSLQNEWYHWKNITGDITLSQKLRLTFTKEHSDMW